MFKTGNEWIVKNDKLFSRMGPQTGVSLRISIKKATLFKYNSKTVKRPLTEFACRDHIKRKNYTETLYFCV